VQSRWIEHRGARILYVDFSSLGEDIDALKAEIESVSMVMERQPDGSVLGLADVRGTVLSREVAAQLKETASRVGRCTKKTAVVLDRVTC
jgi:hypothetical protein